ncbi:MAG: DMT family transporter [Caldilineaceae bacterium]
MSTHVVAVESKPWQGIGFVLLGVILFSIQDVIVKQISGNYPVHEIVWFRSVVALLLLLAAVRFSGNWAQLRTKRLGKQMVRGFLMLLSYITYYLAIAALPLADAIALYFVAPLFVTVLSVLILRERIGQRQWLALACGFVGMLVILRPGTAVFQPIALMSLLAALTYAGSIILNRQLSTTESGMSLAIYATLVYLVVTALVGLIWGRGVAIESHHPSLQFLARAWILPNFTDAVLISITGLIAAIGFFALAQAYRLAEATTVAPFEYVMLLMGVIWGFVFWHEVPDLFAVVGMLLVVSSGIILLPRRKAR